MMENAWPIPRFLQNLYHLIQQIHSKDLLNQNGIEDSILSKTFSNDKKMLMSSGKDT